MHVPLCSRRLAAAVALALATGASAQWVVVNLHDSAERESEATSVEGGHQVGYSRSSVSSSYHASLWSSTAASRVDLHPAVATESYVFGVSGGQQAGWVRVSYLGHASLWTGTAASWVDLHPAVTSWGCDYPLL